MKIAVVADIHGNVLALEAVLADLKNEAPDLIVNLGDCVSGPLWPEETAQILRSTNWLTVRGNHDRVLAEGNVPPENRTDSFTLERLSSHSLEWLSEIPATHWLEDTILLCHGTMDNDCAHLTEEISGGRLVQAQPSLIASRIEDVSASLICAGHTHIPRLITLAERGITILNPGSVGLPGYHDDTPCQHISEAGSPHARYAILEQKMSSWSFSLKAIPYDWERAALEADKNGRPDWAYPLRKGVMPRPV